MIFKANSVKHLILHLVIIAGLFAGILLLFFFVYLPYTTNHGETIEVPEITGKHISELEDVLEAQNLRYQINDSTYTPGAKPLTVLTQHPLPGTQVKKNRKLYITISAANPPKVKMPNLIDVSLKSAEMTLKGYDLVLKEVKYVPSIYSNVVIDQFAQGKKIEPGTPIAKGSNIILYVGNGTGEEIVMDNIIGMPIDEVKVLMAERGLTVSEKTESAPGKPAGTVVRQKPSAGDKIKTGDIVDVWVSDSQ
ncbi:MAG: PASTA domain-containing protein [Cytophagaceae bacterium]